MTYVAVAFDYQAFYVSKRSRERAVIGATGCSISDDGSKRRNKLTDLPARDMSASHYALITALSSRHSPLTAVTIARPYAVLPSKRPRSSAC